MWNDKISIQFNLDTLLKKVNNLINKVHERFIQKGSGDNESIFEILLEKDNEITIHRRNLQVLMIEVYKAINGYVSPIMDNFFIFRKKTHNFRKFEIILNKTRKQLDTV